MEGGINKVHCKGYKVEGKSIGEEPLKMECREGLHYTVEAWLWHVGEPAIAVMSAFAECEEDLAEVAKAHWL